MTKFVSRHCELAKQSRGTSGFWIASQARNDENSVIYDSRNDGAQQIETTKQLFFGCFRKNLYFCAFVNRVERIK